MTFPRQWTKQFRAVEKSHTICAIKKLLTLLTCTCAAVQCATYSTVGYCSVLYSVQLFDVGMSQIPRGDSSDYVVQYDYKISQRSTFQRFVDELRRFVDGKYMLGYVMNCRPSVVVLTAVTSVQHTLDTRNCSLSMMPCYTTIDSAHVLLLWYMWVWSTCC